MAVRLTVPLVTQDTTMECWYASLCMIAYYRRPGPRRGLPTTWSGNRGLYPSQFITLAQHEGLKAILTPGGALTSGHLETMLRNNGPLWCAGYWDGPGHVIVLTGIDGNKLYFNDPLPSVGKREESLAWFNDKLLRVASSVMYMPK